MNDDIEIAEAPREEIARLEARVEELADSLERCRKIAVFARILLAAGAFWLMLELVGIVRFGASTMIAAITAVLGGFILGGSNRSSMQQIQSAIEAAEARRMELIAAIEMRTVDADFETGPQPSSRWLH